MRSYTVASKLDICRRVRRDYDGCISKASRDLNIDRKRIREWLKVEDKLANVNKPRERRHLGTSGRAPVAPALEERLLEWFRQQREQKHVIAYNQVRDRALELT